ncbi:GNAT family N-acetyltransferase [Paenibacillus sp. N1-5-1-14]|uniref:GNAT family N-acetyltransferase n=1 Tax=Paenibacillus radicibacter TaxID=2972488 RepID=UPI002159859D|nr:GNAT family protein [Paenibacillus radicibacter]MCR8645626.1 GNAT family N-acetyltransferase [Paenibacillus radicibacter]
MLTHVIDNQLFLKLFEPRDAEALYQLIQSNRNYLRKWLPWVDGTRTIDDTRSFIESTSVQFTNNNGFTSGIYFNSLLCGMISFHAMDWHNKKTSLGYWLAESYQGRGIMTRTCKEVLTYAFTQLNMNRIEIRAGFHNYQSRAIPERLGFAYEGIARQSEWLYDHFIDHAVYSLLFTDWVNAAK